jgi:hypothetical protein
VSLTAWLWILLILEVLILDALLYRAKRPSLSQWLWKLFRRHPFTRWLVLSGIIAVALHLIFQVWSGPSDPNNPSAQY